MGCKKKPLDGGVGDDDEREAFLVSFHDVNLITIISKRFDLEI